MPNVVAGVLIGVANTSWTAVLIVAMGWGVVWNIYLLTIGSPLLVFQVQQRVLDKGWGTAKAWIVTLMVEYTAAVGASLPVACLTFLVKGWVVQ
jgi:hypothetical protein